MSENGAFPRTLETPAALVQAPPAPVVRSASVTGLRSRLGAGAVKLGKVELVQFPELDPDPITGAVCAVEFRSIGYEAQAEVEERGMDADPRDPTKRRANRQLVPLAIVATAHDPASGERLFTDADDDLAAVRAFPAPLVNRMAAAAFRVLGWSVEAEKRLGEGSGTTEISASSSSSPAS